MSALGCPKGEKSEAAGLSNAARSEPLLSEESLEVGMADIDRARAARTGIEYSFILDKIHCDLDRCKEEPRMRISQNDKE